MGPKVGGRGGEQPTGTTWVKAEVREVTEEERYLNEEASVGMNILGAVRCGESDNDSAGRRHVEKLPGGFPAE